MSEKTQRRRVIKALRPFHAIAVENGFTYPGTPDVNWSEGWIELKWMRKWPNNAWDNVVRLPHFTQQQRVWLTKRESVGGNAKLLLQVGQEWLLFGGTTAAKIVGRATRGELYDGAIFVWKKGLVDKELQKWIGYAELT